MDKTVSVEDVPRVVCNDVTVVLMTATSVINDGEPPTEATAAKTSAIFPKRLLSVEVSELVPIFVFNELIVERIEETLLTRVCALFAR